MQFLNHENFPVAPCLRGNLTLIVCDNCKKRKSGINAQRPRHQTDRPEGRGKNGSGIKSAQKIFLHNSTSLLSFVVVPHGDDVLRAEETQSNIQIRSGKRQLSHSPRLEVRRRGTFLSPPPYLLPSSFRILSSFFF